MANQRMKRKINKQQPWLWRMLVLSSFIAANHLVPADSAPLSEEIYPENFFDDTVNSLLLHRLKELTDLKREMIEEERELAAQMEIQAMLEAKSRNHRVPNMPIPPELPIDEPEMLPIPSPRVDPPPHSGKRTSTYMALCHFKICNMGRKRQLM